MGEKVKKNIFVISLDSITLRHKIDPLKIVVHKRVKARWISIFLKLSPNIKRISCLTREIYYGWEGEKNYVCN